MKKITFCLIFVAFLITSMLSASEYLTITKNDGTVINISLENINSINFDNLDSISSKEEISQVFSVLKNFPNPFNPSTTIEFNLNANAKCDVTIYNIKGEKVNTLFSGNAEQGKQRFLWNGTDQKGIKVASGIYFCKIKSENEKQIKKMLLIK